MLLKNECLFHLGDNFNLFLEYGGTGGWHNQPWERDFGNSTFRPLPWDLNASNKAHMNLHIKIPNKPNQIPNRMNLKVCQAARRAQEQEKGCLAFLIKYLLFQKYVLLKFERRKQMSSCSWNTEAEGGGITNRCSWSLGTAP